MAIEEEEPIAYKTIIVKYTDWGTYQYYASFTVSFGYRGKPVYGTPNMRVRTIWADGQQIYFRDTSASAPKKAFNFDFQFRAGMEDQMPIDGYQLAYRGQILLAFKQFPLGEQPNGLPTITAEFVDEDTYTLAEAMQTFAIRAGYTPETIETVGLDEHNVLGYILTSNATLEQVAADLGYLYDFSMIETPGRVRFKNASDPDGNIVVDLTIPDGYLAVLQEGGSDNQHDNIERNADQNYPWQITATFWDYTNFYAPGQQTVQRGNGPVITNSSELDISISIPIVAESAEIRSRLLDALYRQWEGKNGHSARFPPRFMLADPGDIIKFNYAGAEYVGQITASSLNIDNSLTVAMVERRAEYGVTAIETQAGAPPTQIVDPVEVNAIILDIPDTTNEVSADYLNLRVAVGGKVPNAFYGARIDVTRLDQPNSWAPVVVFTSEVFISQIITAPLPADTSVDINLNNMPMWRLLGGVGQNVAMGRDGGWEIFTYASVVDNEDGTATLNGLVRGLFGTDDYLGKRLDNDWLVFVDDTVLYRYPVDDFKAGVRYLWRCVPAFTPLAEVYSQAYIPSGNSRKPYSPNNVKVRRELNGDITLSWVPDPGDVYTEPDAVFSFDVYTADWSAVARRFVGIVDLNEFTYFIEEQMLDGLNDATAFNILVYQVNTSHTGRGFPGGGTLLVVDTGILKGTAHAEAEVYADLTIGIGWGARVNAEANVTAVATFGTLTISFAAHVEAEANVRADLYVRNAVARTHAEANVTAKLYEVEYPLFKTIEEGEEHYAGSSSWGSIAVPEGTVDGDVLLFIAGIDGRNTQFNFKTFWDLAGPGLTYFDAYNNVQAPGWKQVIEFGNMVDGNSGSWGSGQGNFNEGAYITAWWKLADDEPEEYFWGFWGDQARRRMTMLRFKNADPVNPIFPSARNYQSSLTTAHVAPSIAINRNSYLVDVAFTGRSVLDNSEYTIPTGMTELYSKVGELIAGNYFPIMAIAGKVYEVAATTGTKTFTLVGDTERGLTLALGVRGPLFRPKGKVNAEANVTARLTTWRLKGVVNAEANVTAALHSDGPKAIVNAEANITANLTIPSSGGTNDLEIDGQNVEIDGQQVEME